MKLSELNDNCTLQEEFQLIEEGIWDNIKKGALAAGAAGALAMGSGPGGAAAAADSTPKNDSIRIGTGQDLKVTDVDRTMARLAANLAQNTKKRSLGGMSQDLVDARSNVRSIAVLAKKYGDRLPVEKVVSAMEKKL